MKNVLYFLLLAFFWGTAYVGVKNTVDVLDPYFSALLRVFIGFVFFTGWYLVAKKNFYLPRKQAWKPWAAGFLIMGLPFIFLYWGQQFIPAGTGGIFNATVPIWVFIIGALTIKGEDAFSWPRLCGVALGFVGMLFVFSGAVGGFENLDKAALYGSIALLCMAMCYAGGNVLSRYILTRDITLEQNIFHQHLFSLVFLFFVCLAGGVKIPAMADIMQPKVLISILYVGICSSALALLLLFKLLKEWGALRVSMATYIAPVFAMGADFLLRGRTPTPHEFIGLAIIVASIVIVERIPARK